jgi:hypothetical protein
MATLDGGDGGGDDGAAAAGPAPPAATPATVGEPAGLEPAALGPRQDSEDILE